MRATLMVLSQAVSPAAASASSVEGGVLGRQRRRARERAGPRAQQTTSPGATSCTATASGCCEAGSDLNQAAASELHKGRFQKLSLYFLCKITQRPDPDLVRTEAMSSVSSLRMPGRTASPARLSWPASRVAGPGCSRRAAARSGTPIRPPRSSHAQL